MIYHIIRDNTIPYYKIRQYHIDNIISYIMSYHIISKLVLLPVVPHKAVAEVSKIGNL